MQAGLFLEHTSTIYTFLQRKKPFASNCFTLFLWHMKKRVWTLNFKAIYNISENSLNPTVDWEPCELFSVLPFCRDV